MYDKSKDYEKKEPDRSVNQDKRFKIRMELKTRSHIPHLQRWDKNK